MKKVITYTEEQVLQIKYMLNAVTVTGIQNAKQVAAIAQMLESGTRGEIKEPENKENSSEEFVSRNWKTVPIGTFGASTAQNNAVQSKCKGGKA